MRLGPMIGGLVASSAAAVPAPTPGTRGAGAGTGPDPGSNNTRILLSGEGRIMLATVRAAGVGIDIKVNHSTKGIPSWVAFRAPDTLFAVDEAGTEVRPLRVDLDSLAVEERPAFPGSAGLVHLALVQNGTRLLGAAYGNGSVDVWDVADAGAIKQLPSVRLPAAAKPGPDAERQDKPHPHQVIPHDAAGRLVAVPDLGSDAVHVLAAGDDGGYALVNTVAVEPAGCGPRHGAFHPPAPAPATHLLVLCELKNLINVYAVDAAGAGSKGLALSLVHSVSSFGPGAAHPKAAAGELVLGPDGKDVYVSNRLTADPDDHIAHFRVASSSSSSSSSSVSARSTSSPPSSVSARSTSSPPSSVSARSTSSPPSSASPSPSCAAKGKRADKAGGFKLEFVGQQSSHGQNPRMFSLTGDGAMLLVANGKGESGIWAMARDKDTGELAGAPKWNISMAVFGGKGPQFVQQIR